MRAIQSLLSSGSRKNTRVGVGRLILASAAFVLVGGSAHESLAQSLPTVLFSNLAGDPSLAVPVEVGGSPLNFSNFVRPYVSPNGAHWAMVAGSPGSASRNILLVGPTSGLGAGGNAGAFASTRAVIVAGQPAPGDPPWVNGEVFETIRRNLSVNNAGQVAFSANTSNVTSADEVVVRMGPLMPGEPPAFTLVAREGSPAFGLGGDGVTFGATLDSVSMTHGGVVSFYSTLGGTTTALNTAIWFGETLVARKGETVPGGQVDDPGAVINELRDTRYYRSADGTRWVEGVTLATDASRDRAIVVDGEVVMQEGSILSGSGFDFPIGTHSSGGIGETNMGMDGSWFVRGVNSAINQYWVTRNGSTVATVGDPLTPCDFEHWSIRPFTPAVYFTSIGNGVGDYIVGGASDVFDERLSGVLVLNGRSVVLRSNDPVDLDGDGIAEPNVFIRNFFFDDAALTPDLKLLVVVNLKDELDVQIGKALLIKQLTRPCMADMNADGVIDLADLLDFLSGWGTNLGQVGECLDGDANGDGVVDLADLLDFLGQWSPALGGGCPPPN
ncbi:MAG: hypothetical protein KF768_01210 [Phycisphaeraceae bacterium]|nr:hypothetical protein [Phycisphaeraceae bacterium]